MLLYNVRMPSLHMHISLVLTKGKKMAFTLFLGIRRLEALCVLLPNWVLFSLYAFPFLAKNTQFALNQTDILYNTLRTT